MVCAHHSLRRSLVSSTNSSVARLQALANARATSQEARYTRLIAEKELERRTRNAEAERIRQQEKAQHEKNMTILGVDKKAAVANVILKVFEEALVPRINSKECTSQWVDSPHMLNPLLVNYRSRPGHAQESSNTLDQPKPSSPSAVPKCRSFSQDLVNQLSRNGDKRVQQDTPYNRQPIITLSTLTDVTGSQLIETLTSVNQQIVTGLARQNLPKR